MSVGQADPRQLTIDAQERMQPLVRPKRDDCAKCGKKLMGRQEQYCGKACSGAVYGAAHPRLHPPLPPGQPREPVRVRLLALLMDREWHTLLDLSTKLGEQAQSVSARIRELRNCPTCKRACKEFWHTPMAQIEHRVAKVPYSRHAHEYRLVKP